MKELEFDVEFDEDDNDKILLCPDCGGNCLHQTKIVSIFRKEDSSGIETTVSHKGVVSREISLEEIDKKYKDINLRRDIVEVYFWCEHCSFKDCKSCDDYNDNGCDKFDDCIIDKCDKILQIRQHKGTTYIRWI